MTGTAVERHTPVWELPWMPATCWGAFPRRRRLPHWRRAMFAAARWQCSACGRSAGDPSRPIPLHIAGQDTTLWFTYPVTLTIDHRVPVARGGCSHRHNLTVLCDQCNVDKGTRLPWEHDSGTEPHHNRRADISATWVTEAP